MNALQRVFSVGGHGSATRFAITAVLSVVVIWACNFADPHWGVLPNIAVGIVGGAAVALLVIEAVRWSRARRKPVDRPSPGWAGLAVALACMAAGAVVVGGISWISIGMAENNRDTQAWLAKKRAAEGNNR